jgi:6-phosphogluconolactonase (cycloisomerase 2 family)
MKMHSYWRIASIGCASCIGAFAGAQPGAVYTATNSPAGNEIVVFSREADGSFAHLGNVATGGAGTGGGLGNQGGLVIGGDGEWLLAVNAASNDISVFQITDAGMTLTNVEPSGGMLPISVTMYENLVYVLHGMGPGGIAGFTLDEFGDLSPLAGSNRDLSGAMTTGPAQIQFSPDGAWIVVTEKATSLIDIYAIGADGLASSHSVQPSNGQTPFGFDFSQRGHLIVSEAFGGMPDASAVSSYIVGMNGSLQTVNHSVGTDETAACWIEITNNGRFAYTTNTGSGTVSGYSVRPRDGKLKLLDSDGVTALTGDGSSPIDLALSQNSRFLYVLNSGTNEIAAFEVNKSSGSLTPIGSISGLPDGANGLVAR